MLPFESTCALFLNTEATLSASSGLQYAEPIRSGQPLYRIFTPNLLTILLPRVLITLGGKEPFVFSVTAAYDRGLSVCFVSYIYLDLHHRALPNSAPYQHAAANGKPTSARQCPPHPPGHLDAGQMGRHEATRPIEKMECHETN